MNGEPNRDDLTIKASIERKEQLEATIASALTEFHGSTGLIADGVSVDNEYFYDSRKGGAATLRGISVRCEVRLPDTL